DRQVAGVVPEQALAMVMKERLEIAPRNRAERLITGAMQARDMSGREGAAIGDHQERLRVQVILEELELLGDAGLAVVVAAQGVSADGDGAEIIDDGAQTSVDHLGVVGRVAMRDVRGR